MDIYVVLPLYYRVLDSYSTVRIDSAASAPDSALRRIMYVCNITLHRVISQRNARGRILVSKTARGVNRFSKLELDGVRSSNRNEFGIFIYLCLLLIALTKLYANKLSISLCVPNVKILSAHSPSLLKRSFQEQA